MPTESEVSNNVSSENSGSETVTCATTSWDTNNHNAKVNNNFLLSIRLTVLRRAELLINPTKNAQTLSTHHRGLPQPTSIAETSAQIAYASFMDVIGSFYLRDGNSVMFEPTMSCASMETRCKDTKNF